MSRVRRTTLICDLCDRSHEIGTADGPQTGWGSGTITVWNGKHAVYVLNGPGTEMEICPSCIEILKTALSHCRAMKKA